MTILIMLLGFAVISLTMLDMLVTTLAAQHGSGVLSSRIGRGLWQLALAWHRRQPSHSFLSWMSLVILLCLLILWTLLLWLGWSIVFMASPQAVVLTDTLAPASFWSRVYFAGFTIITLGVGDYRPQGAFWQLLTIVASINGFFVVTLVVTYVTPILTAATEQRQLGSSIHGLGDTPQRILLNAWNGNDVKSLTLPLTLLSGKIGLHGERHHTYPVLHYFHSQYRHTSAVLQIVRLSEALLLLQALPPETQPDPLTLHAVRSALEHYLEGITNSLGVTPERMSPPPDTRLLREEGLLTLSDSALAERLESAAQTRALWQALLEHDGWSWDDVYKT